jgi:hypothetical protein
VHYLTYTIRDNVQVWSGGTADPCDGIFPNGSTLLYETGCVSTTNPTVPPVCPGVPGGVFAGSGGYVDGFIYSTSDEPLIMVALPNCSIPETSGTAWCGAVFDKDGNEIINKCMSSHDGADPICFSSSSQSSSSQSSSSQSSSSQSSSSMSSSSSATGTFSAPAEVFLHSLMTEDELDLTYEEFIDKRANEFFESYPNIFENKTTKEKEEIIIKLVEEGELFVDVALEIASREGIDTND